MSQSAILKYNGKEIELPILTGTENEQAIDIKTLRNETGLITLDPGFKNTAACISKITFLDGGKGRLLYRGYAIEDLANNASFLEVAYLLVFGELPNQMELDKFYTDIKKESSLDDSIKRILDIFPKNTHPMCVLAALTNGLIAFNPETMISETEQDMYQSIVKLMAKFPIMVALAMRHQKDQVTPNFNSEFSYVDNIISMMFKKPSQVYESNPILVNAFNKLLILHADHEQNCSTSTVRISGSSQAALFASISAGITALWGPLHGGANQAVIEMLEAIKADGSDTKKYMAKAKDKNDSFRLMGFGHRVYKNFDPRAKIIKKSADEILVSLGVEDPVLNIAKELEAEALSDQYFIDRKLYPNVDFYSGIIYRALGIPDNMFTVMFALGRLPGWIAQWREMRLNNEPIGRPRQLYQGACKREFKRN